MVAPRGTTRALFISLMLHLEKNQWIYLELTIARQEFESLHEIDAAPAFSGIVKSGRIVLVEKSIIMSKLSVSLIYFGDFI